MGLFDKIFGRRKKTEQETGKVLTMNPKDIWFTAPTISNEYPQTIEKSTETEYDIFIHEDDYRQNEFLNLSSLPQIQEEFNGIKEIWTNHSRKNGEYTLFKTCHVRRTIGFPDLKISFKELKTLLKCNSVGQVIINGDILANGFAIKTDNTTYFGTVNDDTVTELCIAQWNDNTTSEILEIDETFNLVFVNWYHCDLIKND
jgi:hypothetical protein